MTQTSVILFALQSASLIWLLFLAFWALALWFGRGARSRNSFRRRLDQLLVLLLPRTETDGQGPIAALKQGTARGFGREFASSGLRGSVRRLSAPLGAVYAQGYQVAAELISSPTEVVHSGQLVQETVEALKAERAGSGATVPVAEDPVVVIAYGLGVWPAGADLTSLEELLEELGVSHGVLRDRFESLLRAITPANQDREFRELAGASFVLGASARIVEAADPPSRSVPPLGWRAALKTHKQ